LVGVVRTAPAYVHAYLHVSRTDAHMEEVPCDDVCIFSSMSSNSGASMHWCQRLLMVPPSRGPMRVLIGQSKSPPQRNPWIFRISRGRSQSTASKHDDVFEHVCPLFRRAHNSVSLAITSYFSTSLSIAVSHLVSLLDHHLQQTGLAQTVVPSRKLSV
jgi:hypothetical protein